MRPREVCSQADVLSRPSSFQVGSVAQMGSDSPDNCGESLRPEPYEKVPRVVGAQG